MIKRYKVKLDLDIPFINIMEYLDGEQKDTGGLRFLGYIEYGTKFQKNNIFKETMTFVSYSRGRSSIKMLFIDDKRNRYEMFISDFSALFHAGLFKGNKLRGNWAFRKKGSNFGLVYVKD